MTKPNDSWIEAQRRLEIDTLVGRIQNQLRCRDVALFNVPALVGNYHVDVGTLEQVFKMNAAIIVDAQMELAESRRGL